VISALDLESEIRDLTRMALLADQQVFRAIGNLQCKNGRYVELPDMERPPCHPGGSETARRREGA
jgi:hypothetical protein